jgi:oligopeptide transport system substrate-binding protein
MYEDDQLDAMGGLPAGEMVWARQVHARDYLTFPTATTIFLSFDVNKAPYDDPRVRRAFAHTIDKDSLANIVLHGLANPATGGFVSPGLPGYSAAIGLPYNPTHARHLMAEAGFPGGKGFPNVELYLPKGEADVFEFIHKHWSEVLGVDINANLLEWHEMIGWIGKTLPNLFILGWSADYPDPDNFLRVGVRRYIQKGWNESYDQLVENARRETDQVSRLDLYQQAERILIEEAAIVPIVHRRWHLLIKPWIKNLHVSPINSVILKSLIIEAH